MIFEEKDICKLTIKPADSKQFLDGKEFYAKRGNRTNLIETNKIDEFWKNKSKA